MIIFIQNQTSSKEGVYIKRFQKLGIALVLIATLICQAVCVFAREYVFPDIYLKLDVPEDWYAMTRDTPADDPGYQYLGFDPEKMQQHFQDFNMYLYLFPMDDENVPEIQLTVIENEATQFFFGFDYMSGAEEATMFENRKETLEKNLEAIITGSSLHYSPHAKYYVLDYYVTQPVTVYVRSYYTLYNGKIISLSLNSYDIEIPRDHAKSLKDIVNSISFTEALPPSYSAHNQSSFDQFFNRIDVFPISFPSINSFTILIIFLALHGIVASLMIKLIIRNAAALEHSLSRPSSAFGTAFQRIYHQPIWFAIGLCLFYFLPSVMDPYFDYNLLVVVRWVIVLLATIKLVLEIPALKSAVVLYLARKENEIALPKSDASAIEKKLLLHTLIIYVLKNLYFLIVVITMYLCLV